jgi:type III restriction enzyme
LRELVPSDLMERLNQANILITNYHAFLLREKLKAPKLTKKMVNPTGEDVFKETPEEMVRRVCSGFRNKKNIIVINDEAHHCYRRRPEDAPDSAPRPPILGEPVTEKLTGEERKEAQKREEEARIWISGIEAVKKKLGVKAIYDLSATPFFLRGSGYSEGTLFPWVVSDFSLIDAIESRRHRIGDREGAARAGGGRFDDGDSADVPGSVVADKDRAAPEGARDGGGRRDAKAAGGAAGSAAYALQ